MSTPTGIRLNPGQFILENTGISSSGITPATPTSIGGGTIVQGYSNQMAYNVGDVVIFFSSKGTYFKQDGVTFIIINQSDIFFESSPPV